MTMTYQRADDALEAALKGDATPHIWLHTGDPGENGTANVAQTSAPANIVRKAIAFGDVGNHSSNTERRVLNSGAIEWTSAEIADSQTITHFSIWSALTDGQVEFIDTVSENKVVGSDGATIAIGDVEVAVSCHVKPA